MAANALVAACQQGNVSTVCSLLQPGLSTAEVRYNNDLALRHACSHSHVAILRLLLAWVDPVTSRGYSLADLRELRHYIFPCFVRKGCLTDVQYGLSYRDPQTGAGWTLSDIRSENNFLLWSACYHGYLDIVQYLLAWRDPASSQSLLLSDVLYNNGTLLRCLCYHGHVEVLRYLLAWSDATGEHIGSQHIRQDQNCLLRTACECNRVPIVQCLLEWVESESHLIREDIRNDLHESLMMACHDRYLEIIQLLTHYGQYERAEMAELMDPELKALFYPEEDGLLVKPAVDGPLEV